MKCYVYAARHSRKHRNRRLPAQSFFNCDGYKRPIPFESLPSAFVKKYGIQQVSQRPMSRFPSCRKEQAYVAVNLVIGEGLAIDLGLDQFGNHIVTRLEPPSLNNRCQDFRKFLLRARHRA